MGVLLSDPGHVCLYCSTSGKAFGPVFADASAAEDFLSFLGDRDPRDMTDPDLDRLHERWQAIYEKENAA